MKTNRPGWIIAVALAGLTLLGTSRVQAVDVSEYGVLKGRSYYQDEAGTPAEGGGFYGVLAYVRMTADDVVTVASLQAPGWPISFDLDSVNARLLQWEMAISPTPVDLNTLFPNGSYGLTMTTVNNGTKNAALNITGDTYPNTPTFLNFAALGDVNASAVFALTWSAFTGGVANDAIRVAVVDGDDNEVFGSTLAGTATSVNIPAGTLTPDSYYTVALTFIKVTTRDTSSYAGATGLGGYYKNTETSLTTAAGGGGPDTTPPVLLYSYPTNGATGVAASFPVAFNFNEAMAASQSVAWSANVNAGSVNYSWSDDTTLVCTYPGGWPAGATITWSLNPSGQPQNLKDVAGNPLATGVYSGSFTTGGGTSTNDPCSGGSDGRGSGTVGKELAYVQSSNSAPVADPDMPAVFLGMVASPTNNPVTSAKVQVPSGPLLTLTNYFGSFFMAVEQYASQTTLDTARPNGTYNLQLTRTTGSPPSANLSLSGSYPPTPQILNYTAAQAVDPAADFTLQWNGFSGATANDSITLSIVNSQSGWTWTAPDPCVPRLLPNTATSVLIPASTFQSGTTYDTTLTYARVTDVKSNAIPDMTLNAWLRKTVHFTIKTTGTVAGSAKFIGWRVLSGNRMELQLQGTPGQTYFIETASSLTGPWTVITTQPIPTGGVATLEVNITTQPAFFRAWRL